MFLQPTELEEKSTSYFVLVLLCAKKKSMANIIPKEIWVEIWSQVDFKTLQKSCTLVCKYWFGGIRGSTSLSGQMTLNNRETSLEDIDLVLSHWEKLRIVYMRREMSDDELLQLATHPSLEKIYFPKKYELGIWGKVTYVCFDLKNKSSANRIENVVGLELVNFFENWNWRDYDDEVHEPFSKRFKNGDIFSMEPIARSMLNLETLRIFDDSQDSYDLDEEMPDKMKYFEPFFHGLQHCQSLSELILFVDIGKYANFMPNIKKLTIYGHLVIPLENLDCIAKLKNSEVLKLQMLRFEDKDIDVKDCAKECML